MTYEVDPRRGFTHPSMISVWNSPRQMLSHTVTSSSMFTSGDPPQAPSSKDCPLRTGDDHAQPAGKQSCHPRSGPRCGEAVSLTLVDKVDQSADSASPHNQRDPSPKIGLIGHHHKHHVFIVTCDPPHLHAQDDKPEWASTHPTQPHEVHRVVHKVFQRDDREPALLHQSRCDRIHLTATIH